MIRQKTTTECCLRHKRYTHVIARQHDNNMFSIRRQIKVCACVCVYYDYGSDYDEKKKFLE